MKKKPVKKIKKKLKDCPTCGGKGKVSKATTVTLGGPYGLVEFIRWANTWEMVEGLPRCVRAGKTHDGWYGVAIFHDEGDDLLVSHVVYQSRVRQQNYIKGLVFMKAQRL